jgi:hypothetical protein
LSDFINNDRHKELGFQHKYQFFSFLFSDTGYYPNANFLMNLGRIMKVFGDLELSYEDIPEKALPGDFERMIREINIDANNPEKSKELLALFFEDRQDKIKRQFAKNTLRHNGAFNRMIKKHPEKEEDILAMIKKGVMSEKVVCLTCDGKGYIKPTSKSPEKKCPTCNGKKETRLASKLKSKPTT